MAEILLLEPVPPTAADGTGEYRITVAPDNPPPTHGDVLDANGRSEPWSSDNGAAVLVLIFGKPPFVATEKP